MSRENTKSDTIVALSTPMGYSGIGVIRLSGPDSIALLKKVFKTKNECGSVPDRTAVYGKFIDTETGKVLDDGLALIMRGPASYTGEDTVEISLHGSPVVLDRALKIVIANRARLAKKGEFTRRAFLAGKLDLIQAEGVIDLIEAVSVPAAEGARSTLDGDASSEIRKVSDEIKDVLAALEAYLDFDEDEEGTEPLILEPLLNIQNRITSILEHGKSAGLLRDGIRVTIAGKPNVGKSTLFNALLKSDRAIVTPYPGTTRDTVEERLFIDGALINLTDTAGIRSNPDPIEQEGIRRAKEGVQKADLVLVILDASLDLDSLDTEALLSLRDKPAIIVFNKSDLPRRITQEALPSDMRNRPAVMISAREGWGLQELRDRMAESVATMIDPNTRSGLNTRCLLLVEECDKVVGAVIDKLRGNEALSLELISLELKSALSHLEEITGETVDEGVLDRIFERFCIGK